MDIGGFQKNSLIDFPGTIACVLFTHGCNFTCPYCHNPELVSGPRQRAGHCFDEQEILKFLADRKKYLDGIVITGGEPTLQADLIDFCRQVKAMGYQLKLDSNGTRPGVLAQILEENLADYIAMDIKTSLDHYDGVVPGKFDVRNIQDSIDLLMEKAPAYEFRTTCVRPFISREILNEIGAMINGASTYILQQCSRNVNVLDPEFLSEKDVFFSDKEMMEFKKIIDAYVVTSKIR